MTLTGWRQGALAHRLSTCWDDFWYRPAAPFNLACARGVIALQALWLVASRPDLPGLLEWPRALWATVNPMLLVRFGYLGLPAGAERLAYAAAAGALVLTLLGIVPRAAAFVAGLLLYHFAPLEDIFASQGGPFFRGFTTSVAALLVLSFARAPSRGAEPSGEYRWPLALIQLLFSFTYLFSGFSKLIAVGPVWASPRNFEGLVLGLILPEVEPPMSRLFVDNPVLCGAGGLAGLLMDFAFVTAVFSRRAALWIVPAVFVLHVLIYLVLGVFFPGAPLLLLFVDWERLERCVHRVTATMRTADV